MWALLRFKFTWTNADLLSIGPLETNFNEILIKTLPFSFKKIRLKRSLENGAQFVSASLC